MRDLYSVKVRFLGKAKVGCKVVDYSCVSYYMSEGKVALDVMLDEMMKMKSSSIESRLYVYKFYTGIKEEDIRFEIDNYLNGESYLQVFENDNFNEIGRYRFEFKKSTLRRTISHLFYELQSLNLEE